MTEAKRPLKVFLCHAHADRDAVRELYTRLTNDGVDAWLDKEKLLPGQDWELEIKKAVREADVVVVCLSKQFNQAGFRQKEVRLALDTAMEKPEGEIFIIPARLEECDNLESLKKWHWVDLFEEDGYRMLIRALRVRANNIGATLQIKKSWLPKITSPHSKPENPNEPPSDNFPDGWDTEWQPGFGHASKQGDKKPEIPEKKTKIEQLSKKDSQKDRKNRLRLSNKKNIYIGILLFVLVLFLTFGLPPLVGQPESTATLTRTNEITKPVEITLTNTVIPSLNSSTPTNTPELTAIPTSLPTEISDVQGVSMVLIPSGKFTMGASDSFPNESPIHLVNLSTYYIDKYEVTNKNYTLCVQDGECLPPKKRNSKTYPSYFGNSEFDNYPVIYVTWNMAQQYCLWRDARLPSEAEWEKAARGVDGRIYPWGDTIKNSEVNYNGQVGDLTFIGKYNSGVSPYGLFDMAGNAQEWVNDWYQADYYSSLFGDIQDPQGPSAGDERVIRGGSWDAGKNFIRTTYRFKSAPSVSFYNISFRCAKDAQ